MFGKYFMYHELYQRPKEITDVKSDKQFPR